MDSGSISYILFAGIFGGMAGFLFRKNRDDKDELREQVASLRREVDIISSAIKRKD